MTSCYEIYGVLSSEVEDFWLKAAPFIAEGLSYGSLNSSTTVMEKCLGQQMQLWLVLRDGIVCAAFVTELEEHDYARVCAVVALGGKEMENWLDLVEKTLRIFGTAHGCRYVSLEGRKGWSKVLKDFNWKEVSVKLYREL